MKLITVPIDFSAHSDNAASIALQIAKSKHTKVHFIHSLERDEKDTNDINEKMNEYTKKAKTHGIQSESFLEDGLRTHKIITDHIKEHHSDLVIMGSHGLTPGESQFLGTNAQRVVRNASCPVLTVKKHNSSFKMNRIVYPSNFIHENDRMYKKVIDIASLFDAQIDLVYINTPEYFSDTKTILEKMNVFIKQQPYNKTNMNIYNDYNSIDGILNFAQSTDTDVIAMSTLGKSGVHRFLESSITESIVNFSEIPVLSLCFSEIS